MVGTQEQCMVVHRGAGMVGTQTSRVLVYIHLLLLRSCISARMFIYIPDYSYTLAPFLVAPFLLFKKQLQYYKWYGGMVQPD